MLDLGPIQVHLMLNHLPVLGVPFGFGLLAFALATRREETLRVGLGVLVLAAIAAGIVYLSGGAAEEVVEEAARVPEAVIERHEEAAELAAIAAGALGLFALVGLLVSRSRSLPRWFGMGTVIGALLVSGLMAWTANLGGKVGHEELRSGELGSASADPAPVTGEGRDHVLAKARSPRGRWTDASPLPTPLTNNAVAAVTLADGLRLFTFLGLDTTKLHTGITRQALAYEVAGDRWTEVRSVPGPIGRIAATAVGLEGRVYLFGGYTVDADGNEVSTPDVDIYDPATDSYTKGAPFPIPVDDAVAGVWRDSLIFIVSGWSQRDNVADVQMYDPAADRWEEATPIPGPPVFGHAGAVVGDVIVYCDGVRVDPDAEPRFVMAEACYRGEIEPSRPSKVRWRELAHHSGPARYRMAAGALPDEDLIVFAGGTDNPYNYDGVGYDGVASEPSAATFAYDVARDAWRELTGNLVRTMDHRGLVGAGDVLFLIGGMAEGQRVTARVERFELER